MISDGDWTHVPAESGALTALSGGDRPWGPRRRQRPGADWRLIVNGFLPGYLYDHGAVVTTMPLAELIERARISKKARAADALRMFPC